jgi:hypothetical protein
MTIPRGSAWVYPSLAASSRKDSYQIIALKLCHVKSYNTKNTLYFMHKCNTTPPKGASTRCVEKNLHIRKNNPLGLIKKKFPEAREDLNKNLPVQQYLPAGKRSPQPPALAHSPLTSGCRNFSGFSWWNMVRSSMARVESRRWAIGSQVKSNLSG